MCTVVGTPPEHRVPVLHLLQGTAVRPNSGEGPIGRSDPSKRTVPTSSFQIWPALTKKAAISPTAKMGSKLLAGDDPHSPSPDSSRLSPPSADPCANPSFITATDHSIVNRRPICKHGSNASSPNHEHINEQPSRSTDLQHPVSISIPSGFSRRWASDPSSSRSSPAIVNRWVRPIQIRHPKTPADAPAGPSRFRSAMELDGHERAASHEPAARIWHRASGLGIVTVRPFPVGSRTPLISSHPSDSNEQRADHPQIACSNRTRKRPKCAINTAAI
ncbi:hypothetical protein ACLOJK_012081 [Asimina triloba]